MAPGPTVNPAGGEDTSQIETAVAEAALGVVIGSHGEACRLPLLIAAVQCLAAMRTALPIPRLPAAIQAVGKSLASSREPVRSLACRAAEQLIRCARDSVGSNLGAIPGLHEAVQLTTANLAGVLAGEDNNYAARACQHGLSALGRHSAGLAAEVFEMAGRVILRGVSEAALPPQLAQCLFECLTILVTRHAHGDESVLRKAEGVIGPALRVLCADQEGEDQCGMAGYAVSTLTQLLTARHRSGLALPPVYGEVLPHILRKQHWRRSGSVPALAGLVKAYLVACPAVMGTEGPLRSLLELSEAVVREHEASNHEALRLLGEALVRLPAASWTPFLPALAQLLVDTALSKEATKDLRPYATTKLGRALMHLLARWVAGLGAASLSQALGGCGHPGAFGGLLGVSLGKHWDKIGNPADGRVAAVALCHLVCECPELPAESRAGLLAGLVGALQAVDAMGARHGLPEVPEGDGLEDQLAGQLGYSGGAYASKAGEQEAADVVAAAGDLQRYVAAQLQGWQGREPAVVPQLVQSLPTEAQQYLAALPPP